MKRRKPRITNMNVNLSMRGHKVMASMRVMFLLGFVCATLAAVPVFAENLDLEYYADDNFMTTSEGELNIALPLEGAQDNAELSFFVKSASFDRYTDDVTADDLNRIAPAAGIQITFDLEY
jgi:hypothetical protein